MKKLYYDTWEETNEAGLTEKFNEFLDSHYSDDSDGTVKVCGLQYAPSAILSAVDKYAYHEMFLDFCDSEYKEHLDEQGQKIITPIMMKEYGQIFDSLCKDLLQENRDAEWQEVSDFFSGLEQNYYEGNPIDPWEVDNFLKQFE